MKAFMLFATLCFLVLCSAAEEAEDLTKIISSKVNDNGRRSLLSSRSINEENEEDGEDEDEEWNWRKSFKSGFSGGSKYQRNKSKFALDNAKRWAKQGTFSKGGWSNNVKGTYGSAKSFGKTTYNDAKKFGNSIPGGKSAGNWLSKSGKSISKSKAGKSISKAGKSVGKFVKGF